MAGLSHELVSGRYLLPRGCGGGMTGGLSSGLGPRVPLRLWLHRCRAMYLTNVERLALGLEGTPDPTLAQVQAAVTATGYKGYVSFDYVSPPAPVKGGTGGTGGTSGGSPGPSGSAGSAAKRR